MVAIPEHFVEIRIISRSGRELPEEEVKKIVEKHSKEIGQEISGLLDV
jgi:hypothetical protein